MTTKLLADLLPQGRVDLVVCVRPTVDEEADDDPAGQERHQPIVAPATGQQRPANQLGSVRTTVGGLDGRG